MLKTRTKYIAAIGVNVLKKKRSQTSWIPFLMEHGLIPVIFPVVVSRLPAQCFQVEISEPALETPPWLRLQEKPWMCII